MTDSEIGYPKIENSWKTQLIKEFQMPYFLNLRAFLREEKKINDVFPKGNSIFEAMNSTPLDKVKVVILGQDPYHGPGQANGLCFSVNNGVSFPPSLRNIFKELENDLGYPPPKSGDLSSWAKQGVLLLNATLTVRKNEAGSHQKKGWEQFTDKIIQVISDQREHVVFILWGMYAQKKAAAVNLNKHSVLKSPHPSPLSAHKGFFGCKHFSKTNSILKSYHLKEINWQLA